MNRLEQVYADEIDFVQYDIDDPRNAAAKTLYQFTAQPQIVILDAQGKVFASRHSGLTYLALRQSLEQVLAAR